MKTKEFKKAVNPFILLLIKWGAFITEGRGKAGGTVFSKSRSGAYARNKVTPVNRRTNAQQARRSILALFAQNWRALSESQRNTWNTAASNGYTATNIFGDTIKRSGIGLYVGLNINLNLVGESPLTEAPVQGSVASPLAFAPAAAAGANTIFMNCTFDGATDVVPANTHIVVLSSGPVSAGINFVSSKLRVIGYLDPADDTGTLNVNADYEAIFGATVAGQKIFFAVVAINATTGQAGVIFKDSLTVAA